MKKLLFIGMILMSFLIACGDSKNEKQNENQNSEETNDFEGTNDSDIDTVEISDGDTTPDNPDTTNDDDNSGNIKPDDDPEEPPSGGGSCNGKKSYGSTSFTRDESSVFDDCVRESGFSNSYCYFNPEELLPKLQETTIVFKKKCKEKNESVPCPDFIPDSITLSQISGCDIYFVYGDVDCYAECPDFYFSTDNEIFKTVSFHPYEGYISSSVSDLDYAEIYSYNAEKGLSFSIDTGENTAAFKTADSLITVQFQILVDGVVEIDGLQHGCEDSSGRKYNEGDKISSECRAASCSDGEWVEDDVTCYGCHGQEIGDIMKWLCADGITEIDWCLCVEDEEYGSKWSCLNRIDLDCPQ